VTQKYNQIYLAQDKKVQLIFKPVWLQPVFLYIKSLIIILHEGLQSDEF
jgi:hypothetical protein